MNTINFFLEKITTTSFFHKQEKVLMNQEWELSAQHESGVRTSEQNMNQGWEQVHNMNQG